MADKAEEYAMNDLNILIMDDSPMARRVCRMALSSAGYSHVSEATGGREAINMLSEQDCNVDVVLCDLIMPDMDGVQFLRHAAQLKRKPALAFISGGDADLLQGARDTAQARNLRVLGVIQKPATAQSLKQVLANAEQNVEVRKQSRYAPNKSEIAQAIAENQFVLHYQPKVSLSNRKLTGVESLVRWQHPQHGLLSPDNFISAAEQTGQIKALTHQIAMMALKQSASWLQDGFNTKISVNLSPHMLVDLDFPDQIARIAGDMTINPRLIILEVTESGVFQDLANTLDILTRLRMKGFTLSIDDFGTGYSSMEQLRQVPFGELKIDRAFVNGAASDRKAKSILENSVRLGRSLDLQIVAEGAETQEDWEVLESVGVDTVQGFFVARPMPAADLSNWAAARAA